MEKMYRAYEKTIDGKTFYFIKHFITFSEYKDISPVLTGYGMHNDFVKACKIAMIHDVTIQTQLSKELGIKEPSLVQLPEQNRAAVYSFKWKTIPLHSMLRLIRLR